MIYFIIHRSVVLFLPAKFKKVVHRSVTAQIRLCTMSSSASHATTAAAAAAAAAGEAADFMPELQCDPAVTCLISIERFSPQGVLIQRRKSAKPGRVTAGRDHAGTVSVLLEFDQV